MAMVVRDIPSVINLIIEGIYEMAGLGDEDIQVMFNDDIFNVISPQLIDDMVFPQTTNEYYYFKYMVEGREYKTLEESSLVKLHHFFRLTSQLPFVEFQIYDGYLEEKSSSKFALDKSYAAYGSRIRLDEDFRTFIIKSPAKTQAVYQDLKEEFDQGQVVFQCQDDFLDSLDLIENSTSQDKAKLYISVIPAYMGDLNLREDMKKSGKLTDQDYIAWEAMAEIFTNSKMRNAHWIIPQPALDLAFGEKILKTCAGYIEVEDKYVDRLQDQMSLVFQEKWQKMKSPS